MGEVIPDVGCVEATRIKRETPDEPLTRIVLARHEMGSNHTSDCYVSQEQKGSPR